MSEQRTERCENCRFWEIMNLGGDIDSDGECHRFPPTYQRVAEDKNSEISGWHGWFAETGSNDWCGEFQPKIALPVVPQGESKEQELLRQKTWLMGEIDRWRSRLVTANAFDAGLVIREMEIVLEMNARCTL